MRIMLSSITRIGKLNVTLIAATSLIGLIGAACVERTAPVEPVDQGAVDLLASNLFSDFPGQPILDPFGGTVPANSAVLFGAAGSGSATGGPCLSDPEIGALFPRNWLPLRVHFSAPANQNLFEIRLHAPNQMNDLVVYTAATEWIMPADLWARVTSHSNDMPITVSIRGAELSGGTLASGPAMGTNGDITIAPVNANGSIVYWTSSGGTMLRGFEVGEQKVHDVLTVAQVGGGITCVGCHSSTPDGVFAAFEQVVINNPANANIGLRSVDGKATSPNFITPAGAALLGRMSQVQPVFSAGHWRAGDRTALVMAAIGGPYAIHWLDLEAPSQTEGTGWGVLTRTGDSKIAASVAWSRSGKSVAYVSTNTNDNGVIVTDGDIYTVPYNDRKGGAATPVMGASDPALNEFYPAFSPDDSLLAFNRVPQGQTSYNNRASELFIVAASGGKATRLEANDPPACSGLSSPGLTNSWPKWSPEALESEGRKYYWIAFSSTRAGSNPQLFLTGVVVQSGSIKTYRAIYPWNQPSKENNHTAAWDVWKIIVG